MYTSTSLFKPKWLLLMTGACIMLMSSVAANAAIIYVNAAASGANNGSSWMDAYTSLQSALAASNEGDQIWIAKGIYKPSSPVDVDGNGILDTREATFQIRNGVKLYAGFAGGEATPEDRNWQVNLTILSGDLDNNDLNADGNFIAESPDHIIGNNAFHVVYTANVNAATLIDGCIITGGKAYAAGLSNTSPNMSGGGWFNRVSMPVNSSSPGIINCTFQGNYAEANGGAWYGLPGTTGATSEPLFTSCKFYQNKANISGGAIYIGSFQSGIYRPVITASEFNGNRAFRNGGAIYLLGDAASLNNCTFTDNAVTVISEDGSTLPGSGGAVNMVASEATFRSCMFINNKATGNPTGAYEGGGGGAVYMVTGESLTNTLGGANVTFINCGFYGNIASDNTNAWGGAVTHLNDTGLLTASYINCVFSGNQAQQDGGAVAHFSRRLNFDELGFTPSLQTNFTNCTFYNNAAGKDGGALYYNMATNNPMLLTSKIENSIFSGNTAVLSGQHIKNTGTGFAGPLISYSLIEGGYNATLGMNGGNILSGDPQFINAADPDGADNVPGTSDDGLRVNAGSPVVNAGNTAAPGLAGISTDFAGQARLQGSSVDMGAYETTTIYIPPVPIEFYWLREWRGPRPGCLSCPWAIRLFENDLIFYTKKQAIGLPLNFEWKSKAQLIIYGDSAIITGRIASQVIPSIQFDVYLKLIEKSNWEAWAANNRTYSALTPEAKKAADQNYQQWTYWVLSDESRLVGRAAMSGTLKLSHAPENMATGFQLGLGANDMDADFGLNGEFAYSGELRYKKVQHHVNGKGSLNADAQLCENDCSLEDGDKSIAREDFSGMDALQDQLTKSLFYSCYPNPVVEKLTVELNAVQAGTYSFKMFDVRGQLVYHSSSKVNSGIFTIDTRRLVAGIYRLEVISPDGKVQSAKIVHY
jgi:hypothetical protein